MTTRPSPDKRGGAALCCRCGNLRSSPSHKGFRTYANTRGCHPMGVQKGVRPTHPKDAATPNVPLPAGFTSAHEWEKAQRR